MGNHQANHAENHLDPAWSRILRVVFGAVAIVLAFVAVAFPGTALGTTIVLLSVILLIAGIEQIVGGIFHYRDRKIVHIGIGIVVMTLAGAAIVFPTFAALVVVSLTAIALMFSGFSSFIDGIGNKKMPGWARAYSTAIGLISIGASVAALAYPTVGVFLAAVMLALGLLAYGTRLIASGIVGYRRAVLSTRSRTDTGAAAA